MRDLVLAIGLFLAEVFHGGKRRREYIKCSGQLSTWLGYFIKSKRFELNMKLIDGLTGEARTEPYRNIDLGRRGKYQFGIIDEELYVSWPETRSPQESSSFMEYVISDLLEEAIDDDILLMLCYQGTTWDSKMTLTKGAIARLNGRRLWEYVKPSSEELEVLSTSMLALVPEVRVFASATDKYNDQLCSIQAPIQTFVEYSNLGARIATFANDRKFVDYLSEMVKRVESIVSSN